MQFFADLHIHSRYSIACSRDLDPENLSRWGQIKGISVIGSGDFTHPAWLAELRSKLVETEGNLLALEKEVVQPEVPASCKAPVRFLLSAEISCIYKKSGKTRRVHALVFAPDFAAAERLSKGLARIGSIASDGRPILKLDVKDLLQMVMEASHEAMLVPAHAWTPHFSVLGAGSGFSSIEECFEELTPHIYALETGLSSDPAMNWRLSALDRFRLISNSDAHSAAKLGREATIFDGNISYQTIMNALKTGGGLVGTVEYLPEKGKYHSDGHRPCGISLAPQETIVNGFRCPACGKKVTVGVLHRVEELADRPQDYRPVDAAPFYRVIPLQELIAETLGIGAGSKKVERLYFSLVEKLGNEFSILLEKGLDEIAAASSAQIAAALGKVRSGRISVEAGYDGKYGVTKGL